MPVSEDQQLVVIGDRVLIAPDTEKQRTGAGLYLPQGVAEKEKVQSGLIVNIGPGYVIPHTDTGSEPWMSSKHEPHYVPLQVKKGDFAIFLRREAVEIEFSSKKYLIVPQAAILAVVRENISLPPLE